MKMLTIGFEVKNLTDRAVESIIEENFSDRSFRAIKLSEYAYEIKVSEDEGENIFTNIPGKILYSYSNKETMTKLTIDGKSAIMEKSGVRMVIDSVTERISSSKFSISPIGFVVNLTINHEDLDNIENFVKGAFKECFDYRILDILVELSHKHKIEFNYKGKIEDILNKIAHLGSIIPIEQYKIR